MTPYEEYGPNSDRDITIDEVGHIRWEVYRGTDKLITYWSIGDDTSPGTWTIICTGKVVGERLSASDVVLVDAILACIKRSEGITSSLKSHLAVTSPSKSTCSITRERLASALADIPNPARTPKVTAMTIHWLGDVDVHYSCVFPEDRWRFKYGNVTGYGDTLRKSIADYDAKLSRALKVFEVQLVEKA